MNKPIPVTPVDGFLSLVCSAGRHSGCRASEWSCSCPCHRSEAAIDPPVATYGEVRQTGGSFGASGPVASTRPPANALADDQPLDGGSSPRRSTTSTNGDAASLTDAASQ